MYTELLGNIRELQLRYYGGRSPEILSLLSRAPLFLNKNSHNNDNVLNSYKELVSKTNLLQIFFLDYLELLVLGNQINCSFFDHYFSFFEQLILYLLNEDKKFCNDRGLQDPLIKSYVIHLLNDIYYATS